MSALLTIYHPERILVAADSLLQTTDDYERGNITGTATVQKLFVIPSAFTVITACGHSTCGAKSVRTILMEFAKTLPLIISHPEFVSEFSHYILSYFPSMKTDFHLSGFHQGEAFVYDFDRFKESHTVPVRKNLDRFGRPTASVLGFCDSSTTQWCISANPNFWSMSDHQIKDFLFEFFRKEVEIARRKKIPDVAEPIDVVQLDSTSIRPLQLHNPVLAFIRQRNDANTGGI